MDALTNIPDSKKYGQSCWLTSGVERSVSVTSVEAGIGTNASEIEDLFHVLPVARDVSWSDPGGLQGSMGGDDRAKPFSDTEHDDDNVDDVL